MSRNHDRIVAAREAFASGKIEAALALAEEVLSANPHDINAFEIKALAENELGNHEAAEQTLRSAIAMAPQRRWPYADLARLLLKLGRTADAEAVALAALDADFDNPDAHAILGSLLAEREQWMEAAKHFRRALQRAGSHPQLLAGLGQALLRQGHLIEARSQLKSAVAADPSALEPNVYLAEVEERLGRFAEASSQLDRAERLARAIGTDVTLQRSVLLARMGRRDEALDLLDGREGLSGAALLQRGRLRDAAGRHEEAWTDWISGKAQLAVRRGHCYDASGVSAQAQALESFFNSSVAQMLPRAPKAAHVAQPIFIVGSPRSGTTLTEQILASHRLICAGGELPFGSELREVAQSLAPSDAAFPEGLAYIADARWPEILRDHYLQRAQSFGLLGRGAAYFTDKMPGNDIWLPLLRLAFPDSPVILVRRHPLDVLTSVMSHDMTHGFHCAYRLKDAARHLALMDGLLAGYQEAGFGPTYEIRYEALVADQAGETERLMRSIGLPREAAQLSFHRRGTVSPTPSYAQVSEPMNDRSIGRWRNYRSVLEPVRPVLADAMLRRNYLD